MIEDAGVGRVRGEADPSGHRRGDDHQPGRDDGAGAGPGDESRRRVGDHEQHDRERNAAQPGAERVVAEHELQVLGLEEDRAEQAEVERGHRQAGGGEAGVAEQSQVEHRVRAAQLDGDERRPARRTRPTNAAMTALARPSERRALDDRVDERRQSDDRQHRAGQVERRLARDRVTSGRAARRRRRATTQIGTFTQNTEPQ